MKTVSDGRALYGRSAFDLSHKTFSRQPSIKLSSIMRNRARGEYRLILILQGCYSRDENGQRSWSCARRKVNVRLEPQNFARQPKIVTQRQPFETQYPPNAATWDLKHTALRCQEVPRRAEGAEGSRFEVARLKLKESRRPREPTARESGAQHKRTIVSDNGDFGATTAERLLTDLVKILWGWKATNALPE